MPEQPNVQPESEGELSLIDLLVVLVENARFLVTRSLGVGVVVLGIAFLITPSFTAVTAILPPREQQSTAAMLAAQLGAFTAAAGLGSGSLLKNPADLYVALLRSRTVADRMINRFDLMTLYDAKLRMDARKALENSTRIYVTKDGLMIIEVDDEDPKRAAAMANAYVEELSRLTDELAISEAKQRRVFFENQLKMSQEKLIKSQRALGMAGVPENFIMSSPAAVLEGVARLRALVTAQEIKISTMRGFLTEQSPEYRLALRELASLRTQLTKAEEQPAERGQSAEYLDRFREFKYHETLFELLAKQYESSRLDEARQGVSIEVVDVALPPEWKSSPKRALMAVLATLATGMLLVMYLLARESVRRAREVPETAAKLARIVAGLRRLVGRAQK